jgi:CheY-like chemotaxis protein
VVDDNVDAAQSFGMLLESVGHHVRLAYDGEAALIVAEECKPHVIFLDIGLPNLDRYEVARRLRQHPLHRNTRLVAMTGYGHGADRDRAHVAGFDHDLIKPVDFSGVVQILAGVREERPQRSTGPALPRKLSVPARA